MNCFKFFLCSNIESYFINKCIYIWNLDLLHSNSTFFMRWLNIFVLLSLFLTISHILVDIYHALNYNNLHVHMFMQFCSQIEMCSLIFSFISSQTWLFLAPALHTSALLLQMYVKSSTTRVLYWLLRTKYFSTKEKRWKDP